MFGKYIDIHCHPDLFIFNRMRNTSEENGKDFHLWHSDPPANLEKGTILRYSQSDLPTLAQSNFKIVFACLTPIEREFVIGKENTDEKDEGMLKEIQEELIYGDSPVRLLGVSLVTSFPLSRVKFLQSDEYDYFEELKLNYDFYLKDNNKVFSFKPIEQIEGSKKRVLEGKYILVRDFSDVKKLLNSKDNKVRNVAVVLTIEGGHVFGKDSTGEEATIEEILERIDYIKDRWEYPVLFVSPAHHFYSGLCGHARSIPFNVRWVADQEKGMNEGITKLGMAAIRRLLSIDGSLGRRILIDIKHMSPQARKQYYYDIVIPYNRKHPKRKTPIIASHMAYSGVGSLEELIKNSLEEIDKDVEDVNGFYPTSLNLCDEEIKIIADSGGLMGLILNERLLASKERLDEIKDRKDPKEWARIIFEQMGAFVRAIQSQAKTDEDKRKAWQHLAIGSDFDGFCNPPDTFYSAATIPLLEKCLIEVFEEYPDKESLLAGLSVKEAIEKVMYQNAFEFLKRYYQ